jgi:hypothetical protein
MIALQGILILLPHQMELMQQMELVGFEWGRFVGLEGR